MAPPRLPTPRELDQLDLEGILRDPSRKQAFVTPMFEHIAPRYDTFTRWFSLGMDAGWKRELLHGMRPPPTHVLDLACGTGDLALAVAGQFPDATVLGIDAAHAMVERARVRAGNLPRLRFEVGDLGQLPVEDGAMDALTAGYAFRNVPDIARALAEARRVLRAGGMLYALDFYRPAWAPWRSVFVAYLKVAGRAFGWWWHRSPVMYGYIAASIEAWLTIREWEAALGDAGFDLLWRRSHLAGGLAIHGARRR